MTPRGEAVAAEGEIAAGDLRGPEVAGRSGSGFQRIAAEQRLHAGTGGRADDQPIGHGSHGLVPGRSVGRGVREKLAKQAAARARPPSGRRARLCRRRRFVAGSLMV